jgi:hypothetical protein
MEAYLKDALLDLAALDQLEACLADHPDSPAHDLIREYCRLSARAIELRKQVWAEPSMVTFRLRFEAEVLPLLVELDALLQRIVAVYREQEVEELAAEEAEAEDDWGFGGDWWKGEE